jgi:hypothetical protein
MTEFGGRRPRQSEAAVLNFDDPRFDLFSVNSAPLDGKLRADENPPPAFLSGTSAIVHFIRGQRPWRFTRDGLSIAARISTAAYVVALDERERDEGGYYR